MDPATAELARELTEDAYGLMFYWPQQDGTVEAVWSKPGNPARLEALIDAPGASGKARVIAAEILFLRDYSFIERHDRTMIAQIYADALVQRHIPMANPWGLLWFDDSVGAVGGRFAMLGRASIPVLRALLADATVVDWYAGSEEATVGNGQRYRIKDFAAFYLADLLRRPLAFHADFAARDAAIAELLEALDVRPRDGA